jgi:hypothetical protein
MIEEAERTVKSRELAVELYDRWVRERQRGREVEYADGKRVVQEHRKKNFATQLAKPRQNHLKQLAKVSKELTTADTVGLLVMMELPPLEISSLLHRLSAQVAEDPQATYFNKVNQVAVCGSGCG